MSSFIVSDAVITNPIFGNVDYKSWTLSASSLNLADGSEVSEWTAVGPAASTVKSFNQNGSNTAWSFPRFDLDGAFDGTPAVLFNGAQRIMTSTFTPSPQPKSVIVIARVDNVLPGVGITARIWGNGIVNAPNLIVDSNDTVIARCGSVDLVLPNNHEWMGFGISWSDDLLTFVTNDSITSGQLPVAPDAINRNFLGGNNSTAPDPNGLRGAIKEVVLWDRALSATELQQRIADYLVT